MQATTTTPVLTWSTGGYAHAHKLRHAGGYGCDPCWDCGRRPGPREAIWTNNYGDLYCDSCAQRRAAAHNARTAVYDREFDGKPRPWTPDASDLEQGEG